MSRGVILSIQGRQSYRGQEPDSIELVSEGELSYRDGGWDVCYQESELTGLAGVTTTFRVEPGKVTLTRTGAVNSQMVFEEGRQHTSLYETPFGELTVDIQTSELKHNLSERGGLMEIKYSIAVEHTVTGRNCFKIRVKRKH